MKIEAGGIYLIYNDDVNQPKAKFSVCVCVHERWFFLINSEDRKIYDCIPIYKADYGFLKHDSFISCSRKFIYSLDRLRASKFQGLISQKSATEIISKVKSSKTLERGAIKQIIESLDNIDY